VRRARHAVTIPYFEFRELLAYGPETPAASYGLADLRGRRCPDARATIRRTCSFAARDSMGLIPLRTTTTFIPYADLIAGRVDAVLLDHIIAPARLRRAAEQGL